MHKALLVLAAIPLAAGSAAAQLRMPHLIQHNVPLPRPGTAPPGSPLLQGIDALRADFAARSGSAEVYFGLGSAMIGVPAKATLGAQAQWLLAHPDVVVRVEGYGDPRDTRDHALAV